MSDTITPGERTTLSILNGWIKRGGKMNDDFMQRCLEHGVLDAVERRTDEVVEAQVCQQVAKRVLNLCEEDTLAGAVSQLVDWLASQMTSFYYPMRSTNPFANAIDSCRKEAHARCLVELEGLQRLLADTSAT